MNWNSENIEILKTLWTDGVSAIEIACVIGQGVTRNGVIGKAHRLKLDHGRVTARPPRQNGRGDRGGGMIQRIRSQAEADMRTPKPPKLWEGDDADIPVGQRKTVFELKNCHCRWPVGEIDKPGFFFCGHPSADLAASRPYCEHHAKRAWQRRVK